MGEAERGGEDRRGLGDSGAEAVPGATGVRTGRRRGSATATGRGWVGIVANRHAGIGSGRRRVARLVAALRRRGLRAHIAWTPESRALLVADARAERGCLGLVAVGGDGTVAALINETPAVPLTVLPSGTENLFARHFGLDRDPEHLAATIAEGRVAPTDLGLAEGRRFVLMAGVGFDADVVTRHHLARVSKAGRMRPTHRAAYVEPVLRSSFSYPFPRVTVAIADPGREETLTGAMAFVFNLPRYALGLPIAPDARADDGWLDLVVFRDAGPLQALRYLWLVFRGSHLSTVGVEHRPIRRALITAEATVPIQLDGDPGGTITANADRPWTVEVLPRALDVLVPATYQRKSNEQ